jgi:hypothetical protein
VLFMLWLIPKVWRFLARLFRRLRDPFGGDAGAPQAPGS